MLKTTLVLVIEHSKPIPELTDIAAGRIYTLDGVEDVTASPDLLVDVRRALHAWDTSVLPKSYDGMMQEAMECLREVAA